MMTRARDAERFTRLYLKIEFFTRNYLRWITRIFSEYGVCTRNGVLEFTRIFSEY